MWTSVSLPLKAAGVLLALSTILFSTAAAAQDYPTKPVRVIVPFPPGAINDTVGRLIATQLSDRLGKQFIVDNRAGAGGVIGTQLGVGAPPDGYTLIVGSNGTHAINPWLYEKLPYDAVRDFVPVSILGRGYSLLVVHPSVEARSVAELIALAKASPGKLTYGSGGIGTTPHLAGELFEQMAGVKLVHVPYKGSTASTLDLAEGRIHMIFANVPSVLGNVQAGKLRALAVTSQQRAPEFPELPTISEQGLKGFVTEYWQGVFAPAGTPRPLVDRIARDIQTVMSTPEVARQFAPQGVLVRPNTPQQFAAYIQEELARWRDVVKKSGAKAE